MSKKVLFIHAHGLRNDALLRTFFELQSFQVRSLNLDEDFQEIPNLNEFSLIFASGAMGNTLCDQLQMQKLSLKFSNAFKSQNPSQLEHTKFFAFGKAALSLLSSELWIQASSLKDLKSSPDIPGPWRNIRLKDCDLKKISALQLCEQGWSHESPMLLGLSSWAEENDKACGWTIKNLYFSDVDFLALKDSGLHPNYGYFDSSFVSTVSEILVKMKW